MNLKIAFIAQPEYFRFTYEHDLDEVARIREFKFNYSMGIDNFKDLVNYDADINVFFRGEFVPDEVLKHLRGFKIALSSEPFPRIFDGGWEHTMDSIRRYCTFREIRTKPFDYVFHYDRASLPIFEKDGLHLSGEFPFPVATRTYLYSDLPKNWDLFFIGRSTSRRESYFMPLKHYYNFLHICHGVWGSELSNYINSSKICFNIHAENEVSWEPRVQMMLSMKAFVISEKLTPNFYLRSGIDYIEANNPKEIFDAVSYYLNHEEERTQVASHGFNRVKEMLDSRTIFMELFHKILTGGYSKFRAESASLKFNMCSVLIKIMSKLSDLKRNFIN